MSLGRRDLSGWELPGLSIRGPVYRIPLAAVAAVWLLRSLARLLWLLLTRPRVLASAALAAGLGYVLLRWGWVPVVGGLGILAVGLGWWGTRRPAAFDRLLTTPARSRWRRVAVYRRHWQPAMATTGLALSTPGGQLLPELGPVHSTGTVDLVRVTLLPGQTPEQWSLVAPRLARVFGLRELRVRSVPGQPLELELRGMAGDPLSAGVPVPSPATSVAGLQAVPVGRREDGQPFALPLLYSHLLVAGETGSGKGSVLWSLLLGAGPAIRDGLVRVWAIDPKGGMELAAGAPLFDRFVWGEPGAAGEGWQEPIAALLEDAVAGMQARAGRLRGVTRKLVPTVDEPLVLVVVDELAALTAYVTDPKLRARITSALSLLLSQGRAVGISVVAASQDARKETLSMRDLFPARVALRTAEATQADMILGQGARARGAVTDGIPDGTPGVGFVVLDDAPEPVRVRFAHVTDDAIDAAVAAYAPRGARHGAR